MIDEPSSGVSYRLFLSQSLKPLDAVSIKIRARPAVYQSARRGCLTVRQWCLAASIRCARRLDIVSSDKNRNDMWVSYLECLRVNGKA